ncbi:MAG: 50S ribosomal protein L3 [actinobacterium acAMD-5]|jgi:large subunit ribosomal protein L3|nr:MAG: 50S ribosomal protein L3 [actinobacterium acAMD-5]
MKKTVKGVLGEKLGMTQVWDENNQVVPVTVIRAANNVVTSVRTPDTDGYSAVQIAFGELEPRKATKPMLGHFAKAGVTPKRHIAELRTNDAADYQLGQTLGPDVFTPGQYVDVTGTIKGKGFAGTMKRHGFSGLRASHGVQAKHRSPGSIGGCSTPGRTFRGMRMSGHMGTTRTTTPLLKVQGVDVERGLILIRGAVPGPKGSVVLVRTAAKGA